MPTFVKLAGRLKHAFEIQDLERLQTASWELKKDQRFLVPFIALLLLYCGWVFSLPIFLTQDDPMHLYYVNVIHHLLSGKSIFNDFYSIRNPLPPYTIQYLCLLGLTQIFNPVIAEKCMICIILISTAFGFRFLATSIGKNGKLMSLWIFPLALGWPLFMGFHNFCLSLSFTLWALGVWFRAMNTARLFYRIVFVFTVAFVTFTHPVPLVFLLAVISLDTCVRLVWSKLKNLSWGKAIVSLKWNLVLVTLAYCSLGYIALFLNKPGTDEAFAQHQSRITAFKELVTLQLMCLASGGVFTKIYRLSRFAKVLQQVSLKAQ